MFYYAIITIIRSFIDALRIRWKNARVKHPVGNNDISHGVTVAIAVVTAAGLWFYLKGWVINWRTGLFAVGCVAINGMLFDGFLNIFRREKLVYTSDKSSSIVEQKMRRVAFWKRRAIFAGLLIVVVIINLLIHAN